MIRRYRSEVEDGSKRKQIGEPDLDCLRSHKDRGAEIEEREVSRGGRPVNDCLQREVVAGDDFGS